MALFPIYGLGLHIEHVFIIFILSPPVLVLKNKVSISLDLPALIRRKISTHHDRKPSVIRISKLKFQTPCLLGDLLRYLLGRVIPGSSIIRDHISDNVCGNIYRTTSEAVKANPCCMAKGWVIGAVSVDYCEG